jgi:hypothetical protein
MIPVEILNILNAIPGVNGRVYPLQATSNTPKPYIIYKQIEVLEGFSYEGEQRQDHTDKFIKKQASFLIDVLG